LVALFFESIVSAHSMLAGKPPVTPGWVANPCAQWHRAYGNGGQAASGTGVGGKPPVTPCFRCLKARTTSPGIPLARE
jgi:hypothetical protein